ncbi:MAG TPA: NAD(+) diphosphatase [Casimicrobiaceae bacterium]|nr:NAD(+) diphosphatase [Casimicrobiaceae bacterium]
MHTPVGFTPAHAMPDALSTAALVFAFRGDKILVGGDDRAPAILTREEFDATGLAGTCHYLGAYQGIPCIATTMQDDATDVAGLRYTGLRSLFFAVPEALVAIAARAYQVIEWDRTHRYCGRCGTSTHDKAGERAKECPACGYIAYPRVSPAMMALVTRGNELLLARAHRFPPGMYSALAGFVEPGETIEDCIVREVREEVGVEVTDLRYFASQSWSFPHSLMIAFTAEYAGGEIRCDDSEIAEARWFAAGALPPRPPSLSIARRLIDTTAQRLLGC